MFNSSFIATQKTFFGYFLPFLYLLATECISYVVTPFYASKIDDHGIHLVGIALGFTIYNLVIVSTMFGYASIFETYGPQIYGAGKGGGLGTLLIRCLLQGLLVFMIVLAPYYNITHFISFLVNYVQEENTEITPTPDLSIETITSTFIVYTAGFGFIDYCVDILNKYLVTQKRSNVVYVCSTVYLVVYVATLHLLVVMLGLGVTGIALSMYTARGINLILQVAYCCIANKSGNIAWEGISFGIFEGWCEMVQLGVSSIFNMLADTGVVEFATFIALFAGKVQMSIVVVNFESYILILSATFAHCYATSLMLGAAMGESNRQKTVQSLQVIVLNIFVVSIPLAVINWVLRYQIVKLFTNNPEVIELFGSIIWIPCLFTPLNYCVNILTRGVLVAFGRQRFTAILSSTYSKVITHLLFYFTTTSNIDSKLNVAFCNMSFTYYSHE